MQNDWLKIMKAIDRAGLGGRLNREKHWTIQLDWLPTCILDLHASANHSLDSGDVPCLQKQEPLARRHGESCSHRLQFHILTSVAAQSLTPAHLEALSTPQCGPATRPSQKTLASPLCA
jgi:hypothetical protein